MFAREKILDDVARVAGEAVGGLSALSHKIREEVRAHVNDMATRMDLVPREDLSCIEAMVKKLQDRCDAQDARITILEKSLKKSKTKKKT